MTSVHAFATAPTPQVSEGLEGIIATQTTLSDVQGLEGRLILRGKPIEELADSGTYESAVAHLTAELRPALPSIETQFSAGRALAWKHIHVLEQADPPLSVFEMMMLGLAALPESEASDAFVLAGALAVFLANGHRLRQGKPALAPDPDAGVAQDILYMLTDAKAPIEHAAALNRYLITVLDHGLNASTFAARVIASTGAGAKAGLLGAMGALSGPLHGGAPGPVLDMLDAVKASGDAKAWVERELDQGRRLMGFGHRIYRKRDPRADVLKRGLKALSMDAGRLAMAEKLETVARATLAERKPDRTLETNVEFYTAVLLDAIGIDRSLFTPLFAVGRAPGWCAHMAEQKAKGRLIRPQSLYVGP